MSRSESDLLEDIANAIIAIRSHLRHGPLSQGLVMDAGRRGYVSRTGNKVATDRWDA